MPDASAPEPSLVWTVRPETPIYDDVGGAYAVPHVFTRLEVIGRDSVGLKVVCSLCPERREGYIDEGDYIREGTDYVPPEVAMWGTLPELALSIRTAALQHDLDALRPVMAPDFTFSFVGIQTPETAFDTWRFEDFSSLDQLPGLLDRGLATRDSVIWSAPPAFVEEVTYRGLRTGFRRSEGGRWEWLYLIRGIADP